MSLRIVLAAALSVALAAPAAAQTSGQQLAIYPAKGQSAAKQSKDRQACDRWAVEQTGFDPALAQPPPEKKGGIAKGGLLGAAGGALVGSLSGDAGKGAVIGGLAGGTIGGVRQSNKNKDAQARQGQNLEGYNNALAACLTGRGYTVR